jgi:hypothetical protein
MVPTVVLPPVAPLTCQVTPVSVALETVAEKLTLPVPITTLAEVGAIVTTAAGVTPLLPLPTLPPLPPPPHAATMSGSSSELRLSLNPLTEVTGFPRVERRRIDRKHICCYSMRTIL